MIDCPPVDWSGGVCVVAGEASGDVQTAHVVRALQERLRSTGGPCPHFWGAAGPSLRAVGVEALVRTEDLAVMGLAEIVSSLPKLVNAYKTLLQALRERAPAALICVDYPGFNMRLMQDAYQLGLTVINHIPPKVWAHGAGRMATLRDCTHLVTCILPFEERALRDAGINAHFIGNPLRDAVDDFRAQNSKAHGKRQQRAAPSTQPETPQSICIALLPGSRQSEIRRVLPLLVSSLWQLSCELGERFALKGLLPVAATLDPSFVMGVALEVAKKCGCPEGWIANHLDFMPGANYEVMAQADYAWVCSGTATLETAFFETPLAAVYRMNPLSHAIAKQLVKVPFVSLVNLCAQKALIREFIQDDATPAALVHDAKRCLFEAGHAERMSASLAELRGLFAPKSDFRTADLILATISELAGLSPAEKFHWQRRQGTRAVENKHV